MKNFILLFCLMLNLSVSVFADNLEVITRKLKVGDNLVLKYNPKEFFKEDDTLFAYIYCFQNGASTPIAYQVDLQKNAGDKNATGSFTIPENTIYGLIKVGTKVNFDTKGKEFWDFLIVNNSGKEVQGANFREGASYLGNLPSNCQREPDFIKALDYLTKETLSYPENTFADIARTSLEFDLKLTTDIEFDKKMRKIIIKMSEPNDDESLQLLTKALRAIGETEKAEKYYDVYLSEHPKSKLSDDVILKNIAKINNFRDFIDKSVSYLTSNSKSSLKEKLYLGIVQSYMQIGDLKSLVKLLDSVNAPGEIYSQLATNLINNDKMEEKFDKETRLNIALNGIEKAIGIYKNLTVKDKPDNLTINEWQTNLEQKLSEYYYIRGNIFKEKDQAELANENYLISYNLILSKAPAILYHDIIDYYISKNSFQEVLNFSSKAMVNDISDSHIDSLNKVAYYIVQPYKKYNDYYDSLINVSNTQQLNNLKMNKINSVINFPMIKSLDDITVHLKMYQGKVLIVYAWASWCESCVEYFATLEKLQSLYKDDPNVMIIPVYLWNKSENLEKDISDFIEENKLKMTIYIDSYNEVYKNLSIAGIPSLVMIGKDGRINFRLAGIDTKSEDLDDLQDRINFLLNSN